MPPKKAPVARKPTLPKASAAKPVVINTHDDAVKAARGAVHHVLVHKALLSHYVNVLTAHKKSGGAVPQSMIDNLRKHSHGKDTHAAMSGGSFKSFFGKVGDAFKTAGKWVGNAAVDTGKFLVNNAGKAADIAANVVDKVAPIVAAAAPIIKAVAI
jgi:hypothetical protein